MRDQKYFDSPAIGSSLLANFMKGQDHALKEVQPTGFMEEGRIFEDLIQEKATGEDIFGKKYFSSDMDLSPDSAAWKKLLPIFEDNSNIVDDIENAYVWKNPDKYGKVELNCTHKKLHRALDQIKAHNYRRLVPESTWTRFKAMLENFQLAEFKHPDWPNGINLFQMLCGPGVKFQKTHFWTSESGAYCRMKSDIEFFWQNEGVNCALIADLKLTANWPTFLQNWRNNYIWQSKHYLEGFRKYCLDNEIWPPNEIWYFVQESTYPYLLHSIALSHDDLAFIDQEYEEGLINCQRWIDAGKPKKGYVETCFVNRWGKPI
jgi:hypothetical protein